jgi:hypothetical protein
MFDTSDGGAVKCMKGEEVSPFALQPAMPTI